MIPLALLAFLFAGLAGCSADPAPDPCEVAPEHPCAWPPGTPPAAVDAGLCDDAGDGGCAR